MDSVWIVEAEECPGYWTCQAVFASCEAAEEYVLHQKERKKNSRSGCPTYCVSEWGICILASEAWE